MGIRRGQIVAATSVVALFIATATPSLASAAIAPAGSVGHDVSFPQCTAAGSSTTTTGDELGGDFGIVGVTGGQPWGPNSCAAAEYSWARGLPYAPALYLNTANPAPRSNFYWPTSGTKDPVLCRDASSTADPGCAYDYGWHSALDALTKQAATLSDAGTRTWWLDVERANSWNGDGASNAADLQGAVDYLRSHGVPSVGIYSSSAQWTSITGGYDDSTASLYASAWQPEFNAAYPLTLAPLWIAGLGDVSSATTACGTSFTGAPAELAQFDDGSGFGADLVCGATPGGAPPSDQN